MGVSVYANNRQHTPENRYSCYTRLTSEPHPLYPKDVFIIFSKILKIKDIGFDRGFSATNRVPVALACWDRS